MIRYWLLIIIGEIILFITPVFGQEYNINNIPENLKVDAYAVVRKNHIECTVEENILCKKEKIAITILNKSGDFLNDFTEYYDDTKNIKSASVIFYNSQGKKINSFKKKDFKDYSAVSGFSLYEDTRVLYFKPSINVYPYTVEYYTETEEKDFISFPVWDPFPAKHVSLQSTEYKLIVPEFYKINYKFLNTDKDFTLSSKDEEKTYSVSMTNQSIIESEFYSPYSEDIYPMAIIVPVSFEMDNFPGNFSSWKEFGKWIWTLKEGRDILTDNVRQEIIEISSPGKTDREKVLLLYHHLQNTTRYVNVSLGIGGYQPYPAMTVYENGYGDCKALSNYMYAMLKAIDIQSYYTLIKAGESEKDIFTDFPSQQFNHAILCVPFEEDSLWLECTSQTSPAGFMGRFTDNRSVLLIDENGGHLAKTLKYDSDDNLQIRNANVEIDLTTKILHSDIHTEYSGQQYSSVGSLSLEPQKKQKENLQESINIPQFDLKYFEVQKKTGGSFPVGIIDLNLEIQNYLTKSGTRFFLPLNLMNKYSSAPKPDKDRINDVLVSYSYHDIDSIIYHIPEELNIAYIPKEISMKESFGEYHFQCIQEGQSLKMIREIKMIKGCYPKEIYPSFVNFFMEILKADRAKAMLQEKNT